MPEGRIQLLEHHTRDTVWQARWLGHANGIVALKAVLIAVAVPEAAAARFGRFAGRAPSRREADRWTLELDRGVCSFVQHRSEEHTSELQSLMRISYAVFCLKTTLPTK